MLNFNFNSAEMVSLCFDSLQFWCTYIDSGGVRHILVFNHFKRKIVDLMVLHRKANSEQFYFEILRRRYDLIETSLKQAGQIQ